MSGWSIDRIEEGWAVCEGPDDEMIRLEVSRLPAGVREGDCLFLDGSTVAKASPIDQLHMDKDNHRALAEAVADIVKTYFEA